MRPAAYTASMLPVLAKYTVKLFSKKTNVEMTLYYIYPLAYFFFILTSCGTQWIGGSVIKPTSWYQKVAGSIPNPLVGTLHGSHRHQCMYELL